MVKVKDIMSKEVVTISADAEVTQAARVLLEKHINGMPVVDSDGRLVGIICQSDLIIQQKRFPLPSVFNLLDSFIPLVSTTRIEKEVQKMAAVSVADAMTRDPVTVTPETPLENVATIMVNKGFHTLPVVDHGKLIGVIGKEDVLRTLMPEGDKEGTSTPV